MSFLHCAMGFRLIGCRGLWLIMSLVVCAPVVAKPAGKAGKAQKTETATAIDPAQEQPKATFSTRFRPSLVGMVPVALPMGSLGNVLGLGLGFNAGGSLSLNGLDFLSGLTKKNLRLDACLLLGFYTYKTKSSAETAGSAMVLPGQLFLRLGYPVKLNGKTLEPFAYLGSGAAYVKTERSAAPGVSANTETSIDFLLAPGLGARYEITPKVGIVFLTTYEIYFEQVSGSFLSMRLGVDYVF